MKTATTDTCSHASPGRFGKKMVMNLLLLAVLFTIPLLLNNPFHLNILTLIFLWSAMAGAWNILGGYAGRFSLGNAAFFGTGAYTSSILFTKLGISPWIGMIAGASISLLLALILGLITLRLRGTFFCLCTIAVISLMEIMATHFRGLTNGAEGIVIPYMPSLPNMVFDTDLPWAYIMLSFMLIVYFLTHFCENRPLGYRWNALRENEEAAEALGINTLHAKISAFIISAVLTSIGGSLYAQYTLFIEPIYVYSVDLSVQFAMYAIIGGMGTALGPIVGAAVLTPVTIILRSSFPELASGVSMACYALVLIIAVLFFPNGIVSVCKNYLKKTIDH